MNDQPESAANAQPRARSSAQTDSEQPNLTLDHDLPLMGGHTGDWGVGSDEGGQTAAPSHVGKNGKTGGQRAKVFRLPTIPLAPSALHFQVGAPGKSIESIPCSPPTGEQPSAERASRWIKDLLPEVSNGWWEVRFERQGYAIKLRWRDQGRQTLAFPRLTGGQLKTLEVGSRSEAKEWIRTQIINCLYALALDPLRRDKARSAALRLGVDLEISRASHTRD